MTAKQTRKQKQRRRRRAVFLLLLLAVLGGVGFVLLFTLAPLLAILCVG